MKEDKNNLKDSIIADPKILAGKPVVKVLRERGFEGKPFYFSRGRDQDI